MDGIVKFYIQKQGFGFIRPDDGSADIFFHFTGIFEEGYAPKQDEKVTYDIKDGKKTGPNGEKLPNAYNVKIKIVTNEQPTTA
jgi:CspA family cold shock protein